MDKKPEKTTQALDYEALLNLSDKDFTKFVKQSRGIYGKEHDKTVLNVAPQSIQEVEYKLITSGRQWKHNTANLLLLIESLKPLVITAKDDLRDFALSSYNKRLVARFGTQQTVNKILNMAVEVGLLLIDNNRGCNNLTHIATTYIYNQQVADYIQIIAMQANIAMTESKNNKQGNKSSGKTTKNLFPISPNRTNLRKDNKKPSNINEFGNCKGNKSSGKTDKNFSPISISPNRTNLRGGDKSSEAGYTINATMPDDAYMADLCIDDEELITRTTKEKIWKLIEKMKQSPKADHKEISNAIEILIDFYDDNAITNGYKGKAKIYSKQRIANVKVDEYMEALHAEYPQIKDYQQKIEKLNEKSDDDMAKITMTPNLHISGSGTLTKTGIRAYCPYCQLTAEDRKAYLKNLWGDCQEYDRKASIHSLTYFLNNGTVIPENEDIYPYLFQGIDKWQDEDARYIQCSFGSDKQRQNYKDIYAQRLYFCKSPRGLMQSLASGAKKNDKIQKLVDSDNFKEQVEQVRTNYYKLIGKSLDSEIFLHESCIMIDLCLAIQERGYKVVNIFDCVYSDCPNLAELCAELMPALMENYAREYYWGI